MTSANNHAVFFDLDGTLIESVGSLAAAVNKALAKNDLAPLSLDDVGGMIGNGLAKLVLRAYRSRGIDLDETALAQQYAAVLGYYESDLYSETELLPGAREVISKCSQAGISTAVITNKPQRASELILRHFDLETLIDLVVGGDLDIPRKPAPDMIEYALSKLSVDRSKAIMVGDSPADAGAARSAGVRRVIVRGGYGVDKNAFRLTQSDCVIDDLTELSIDTLLPDVS